MDKKLFLKSLNSLESAFGEKVSGARAKIYWDILKSYSDVEIKKAVVKAIRELKFFPKISEIIEIIEGRIEDEAELAWLNFIDKLETEGSYLSVIFPKYPAIGATIEVMGGWVKVSDMTVNEEKWVKKEFIKLYPIMKGRGNYPDKLIGRFELENSNKGYNEKYLLERYGRYLNGTKVKRKKLLKEKIK